MTKALKWAVAAFLISAMPALADDLVIGAKAEPVMDPHYQWTDANMAYYKQIFGGLTDTDSNSQVIPGLAETWETPSPTEWIFHLRHAKFSDGTPVTAKDVVDSYHRMESIKAAVTYTGAVSNLKDITAVDDYTVKLTFSAPNPLAAAQVSLIQIIPSRLADATSEEFTNGKAVIGFGPYKLSSFKPGESLMLERNPDYYGKPAKWDHVTFRFLKDPAARVAALLGGDVDFIDAVPPSLVNRIRDEKGYHVITGPSGRSIMMTLDTERAKSPFITTKAGAPMDKNPLQDLRVREALTHAIDRQAIAERVMDGLAFPSGQITPPGYGGYNKNIPVPSYDPALSKKLLAEAGYPDGFGMKIDCPNDRYVEDAKICQALGQMFTRIGLKIEVETLPSAVLTPRAMDKNGQRFTMAMLGWSDSFGEAKVLSYVVHTPSSKQGTWNWGHYSNPTVDKAIDDAQAEPDVSKRYALLAVAMKKAMDDVAVLPIHNQSVVVAAKDGYSYQTWLNEYTIADSVSKAAK